MPSGPILPHRSAQNVSESSIAIIGSIKYHAAMCDKYPVHGSSAFATSPTRFKWLRRSSILFCTISPITDDNINKRHCSAGIEEKESIKPANSDNSTANLCCSPGIMPLDYQEGTWFNVENLELSSIANLSLFINDLLQSSDPNSLETGYVRTSSMNKLLVCKVDILKALEVTESEIDSLETELKTLSAGCNSCHPCPAACHLKSGEPLLEPCEEHAAASGSTAVPPLRKLQRKSHKMFDLSQTGYRRN
ncbi:uncharacterized protein LOC127245090 [Andrographis paniculata]|uniref:uncharacterized protein LOC127245090 n=1 Tax=Andrographis paniculata TaxID=175694 RepID=UPI0021E93B4E|nr:uncharacterized protein LOC127245090 [Andrographis paniculata]